MTSPARTVPPADSNSTIELPAPTAWPIIAAFGITLAAGGLVTNLIVSVIGVVLLAVGAVGWFRDVLPEESHESLPIAPSERRELEAPPQTFAVQLEVGEHAHRARLPLEIYPYSVGIRGGLYGGAAMALLAVLYGVVVYRSLWYTTNLLAAAAIAGLATADFTTLSAFHPEALIVAGVVHLLVSALFGLLYAVLLPILPRRPVFFGGFIAPLLWTGLLWATLDVVNPVLNARIDWTWFVITQIAFGLTAGWTVARSERIATLQHLPLAARAGIERARGRNQPGGHDQGPTSGR